MKRAFLLCVASALVWLPVHAAFAGNEQECKAWRAFADSVKPGEERSFVFRTNWGGGFTDDSQTSDSLASKRCEHHDYAPAQALCDVLMREASIEDAGANLKVAMLCVSDGGPLNGVWFETAKLSLTYGDRNRGTGVEFELAEDPQLGGMVLNVTASGY